MEKILFEDEKVKFWIEESVPCLVNDYKQPMSQADLEKYLLQLVEIAARERQNYPGLKLLSHTDHLDAMSSESIDWIASNVNPRWVELGFSAKAFVVTENPFTKLGMSRYERKSHDSDGLTVATFGSTQEALDWLKSL